MSSPAVEDLRKQIDEIDRRLVSLFNERARIAIEIGKLKKSQGLPIKAKDREQEVIDRAAQSSAGPLSQKSISRLFRTIISEMRKLQADLASGPCSSVR